MAKRSANPPSVGEILENFLRRSGLRRRVEEQRLMDAWGKVVGEAIAERTQPMGMRNGVLRVKVDSSVWMQQLQFMKELMIRKLQEQSGNRFLRDVRFFLGEIEPTAEREKRGRDEKCPEGLSPSLTKEERQRIKKALSGLRDPEMRDIFWRVYSKGVAAGKKRMGK